jgi:hypothetical protein
LLKKKGWTWPPDEKLKQQIHEAMRRLSGSVKVPEELWDEVFEGIRGFEHVRCAKKL